MPCVKYGIKHPAWSVSQNSRWDWYMEKWRKHGTVPVSKDSAMKVYRGMKLKLHVFYNTPSQTLKTTIGIGNKWATICFRKTDVL